MHKRNAIWILSATIAALVTLACLMFGQKNDYESGKALFEQIVTSPFPRFSKFQWHSTPGREPTIVFFIESDEEIVSSVAEALNVGPSDFESIAIAERRARNQIKRADLPNPLPPDSLAVQIGRISSKSFFVTALRDNRRMWIVLQRY
jgi:hypothetical protein